MSTPEYNLAQPKGERVVGFRCEQCDRLHTDEYAADVCCGGHPSQRALEARGQMRLDDL